MSAWHPFVRTTLKPRKFSVEQIMQSENVTREYAEAVLARENAAPCFVNNLYQVIVYDVTSKEPGSKEMVWLSIKRLDKRHIHDWRDLQRIKNELVGEECEGFEIYPAESRLIDEANQYHLWVFKDPAFRLGVGFMEGRKVGDWDKAKKIGARQRPLPEYMKK